MLKYKAISSHNMKPKLIAYNIGNPYDKEVILLTEFGIGGIMNVVPIWAIIKFATFIGSHFGPFKGFFKGLGLAIGTLFTLGTIYNTINAYITKIKVANGVLSFVKVAKNLLVSSPGEVAAEVEYEEFEKRMQQEIDKEINEDEILGIGEKEETSKTEKFLIEQEQKSIALISNFKNLVQKISIITTQIPFEKPKKIISDFMKAASNFISKKTLKQTLLEFGFIKRIFSSMKKVIALVLGLVLSLIAIVMIGSFIYYVKKYKNFKLRNFIDWMFRRGDNKLSNNDVKELSEEIGPNSGKQSSDQSVNQLFEVNISSVKKIVDPKLSKVANNFGNDFKRILVGFKDIVKKDPTNGLQKMVGIMNRIADKALVFFRNLSTKTL